MKRLVLVLTLMAGFAGALFADEVFYGVKIKGDDYYVQKIWDALVLIKATSAPYYMRGQMGWWTIVKRGGLKLIQCYTEENYTDYFQDENYSGIPGGYVKGGESTIYLLEAEWTEKQYAEMIIHEAVHVLANRIYAKNRKNYRQIFGDSDGEEVLAEKWVKDFAERVNSDELTRSINSYQYNY